MKEPVFEVFARKGREEPLRHIGFVNAMDDSFKVFFENGRISNCVVWQGMNGSVFQYGWYRKNASGNQITDMDIIDMASIATDIIFPAITIKDIWGGIGALPSLSCRNLGCTVGDIQGCIGKRAAV